MAGELNLKQLRAFYIAAKLGSVTLAADRLFITQPAVSMQIKALEAYFEVRLFDRKGRKLELTPLGRRLYRIAQSIFDLVSEAESVLSEVRDAEPQVLKIGSTKTLVRYLLARHISKFRKAFPEIQIQVDEGSSAQMVESVRKKHSDLAIVGRMLYHEALRPIPFIHDELVLLAAPSHPLCEKGSISIDDLAGENLLLREQGSGTRRLVEKILERTGMVSSAFIQSGNVDFIKELVRTGNGITMLARMGVDRDVSRGDLKILELREGNAILHIDIVVRREVPLSKASQAFVDVLTEGESGRDRYVPGSKPVSTRDDAQASLPT